MAGYDSVRWRKATSPLKLGGGYSTARSTLADDLSFEKDGGSSLRGSTRIIADLEKQHEESLTRAYDRLQVTDDSHEREIHSLKAQVASFRQELAATSLGNAAELKDLRAQFQSRLESEARLRAAAVNSANEKLTGTQQVWASESDRSTELRHELLALKARNSEENAQIQSETRRLAQDLDYLKQQSVTKLQTEMDRGRLDKKRTEDELGRRTEILKQQLQTEVNEWQNRLAAKEAVVRNAEVEVSELRRQLQVKTEAGERDVRGLQETLKSLRTVVELQEADLTRLKQSREEARRNAKQMSSEVTRLEKEMKRVSSENQLLRSSSAKLGKLVYGKGSRGNASPQ